jgi:dienelactone hydrolase
MPDNELRPDQIFDAFIASQCAAPRKDDRTIVNRDQWEERRQLLRQRMFRAMGPFPANPDPLEVRDAGVLQRKGYRIDKLIIRTRPGVWASASAYVPDGVKGKVPAVLAVHGHWAGARRDPVVQARCLGLVKLGFFVLAVDAFGAGERHPQPGPGAYHGALHGSALWPAGHTLLGMQVYDNRRLVDYLLTRPEVDGSKLGITGASGGGNQTMYAGALDERFSAVVPVCSVGTYHAYLKAACCVCEVLPGALEFTEEGEVLGLVAPRALMVISATRDALQFSVGEAAKSIGCARTIYKLYQAEDRLEHRRFESQHDYNQAMREAMYGWMTKWLKGEGDGKPIAEPKHDIEKPDDLACFPDGKRPPGFLFPASFAAREARRALAPFSMPQLDHKEAWESLAATMRDVELPRVLGERSRPAALVEVMKVEEADGFATSLLVVPAEPGVKVRAVLRVKQGARAKQAPDFVFLHLDGQTESFKHPLAIALMDCGAAVLAPDLRATGWMKPAHDAIAGAPDHNSAEHSIWIGRPLLGQWVVDVRALVDWLNISSENRREPTIVVGIGEASLVAFCAAALDSQISAVAAIDPLATLITEVAYPAGFHMGLLAPGLLTVGDVPHLAALTAPRPLVLAGTVRPADYAFTREIYALEKVAERLQFLEGAKVGEVAAKLMALK